MRAGGPASETVGKSCLVAPPALTSALTISNDHVTSIGDVQPFPTSVCFQSEGKIRTETLRRFILPTPKPLTHKRERQANRHSPRRP